MITILAEVSINDLEHFLKVFSSAGLTARRKHQSLSSRVYKVEANPRQIFILFEWASRENFENFLSDPQVGETMKASGTTAPPKFIFLDKAAEFEG